MTGCSAVDEIASSVEECTVDTSNCAGVLISCGVVVDRPIAVSVVIEV